MSQDVILGSDCPTCGCGDGIDHPYDSHYGIPMGCDCYKAK